MKKLFVLVVGLALISCQQESKVDYVLLSGTITNPNSETLSFRGNDFRQKISVSKDGVFADTLRVEAGYYSFNDGKEGSTIFLSPGYNLNLTLNTNEFDETLKYSGEGAENNNYLVSKALNQEKLYGKISEVFSLDEAAFLSKLNEVKTSQESLFKKTADLSEEFIALEKKNLKFDYLGSIQNYPSYHKYFAKKENVVVSEDFMSPLKDVNFTNEQDYNTISSYKRVVQNHFSTRLEQTDDIKGVFSELESMDAPKIKNDLAKSLAYEVSPNNENNDAYYAGILALSSDDKFKEGLTTKYEKVKELVKGKPSPLFTKYENHKGGTTSLTDLKGKYVYVDVWATWCGPCKREIPYLKEVEKAYHGKNIEFVSTSIDVAKDHEVWVKMVAEKELGGVQLMADNDWKSKFVTDYAIEGIPRFLLIDPDGKIVSADAPRPSDPKLVKLFEELKI